MLENQIDCLVEAAAFGDFNNVYKLVREGVDINGKYSGSNPLLQDNVTLFEACRNNHKCIVMFLLEHDVDVNLSCRHGMTALHITIKNKNLELMDRLIKYGADIYKRDLSGKSPVEIAYENEISLPLVNKKQSNLTIDCSNLNHIIAAEKITSKKQHCNDRRSCKRAFFDLFKKRKKEIAYSDELPNKLTVGNQEESNLHPSIINSSFDEARHTLDVLKHGAEKNSGNSECTCGKCLQEQTNTPNPSTPQILSPNFSSFKDSFFDSSPHYLILEGNNHFLSPANHYSSEYQKHFILQERYSSIELIKSGAFGKVFKVQLQANKKNTHKGPRAIKIISFNTLRELNRAFKEALKLSQLHHENILKIYDCYLIDNNSICIEMEYYEIGDLNGYFLERNIKLQEFQIKQITKQMCRVLQYLKEKHVLHRDIKPSNILIKSISDNGNIEIVLGDFGLARSVQTSLMSYGGTFAFMSPERLLGNVQAEMDSDEESSLIPINDTSYNSDVYSLGVSLYQLMSHDVKTSIVGLYWKKSEEQVRQILKENILRNYTYSNELIELVLDMLRKDCDFRPQAFVVLHSNVLQ
ncbi:hypothetical protein ABK040_006408 [Willaertia magna]